MIKIGDYVTFTDYEELRGIVLEGPHIECDSRAKYRVMWEEVGKPEHWRALVQGSWEDGSNITVLSSLETK